MRINLSDNISARTAAHAIALTIFYSILLVFLGGLAFMLGWNWFVVDITGFKPLTYFHGLGIAYCISVIDTIMADTRVRPVSAGQYGYAPNMASPITNSPIISVTIQFLFLLLNTLFAIGVMTTIHLLIVHIS